MSEQIPAWLLESTAQENLEAATQTLRELQAATKAAAKVVKKMEAQKNG